MKHFTWIGALALAVVAGVVYWTRPEPNLVVNPMAIEHQVAEGGPVSLPTPAFPDYVIAENAVFETIMVLPEWEIAPQPELISDVRIGSKRDLGSFDSIQAKSSSTRRPETGRDPRPWMPYAPEDVELSATRRLEWAKLLTQEPALTSEGSYEETAEPPLLDTPKR